MLRTPQNIADNDITRWFRGGWVSITGYDGPQLVTDAPRYVDEARCIAHSNGHPDATVFVTPLSMVFAHWPRLGSVNLSRYAVHVQRLPVKVYKRTFNAEVLDCVVPCAWEISSRLPLSPVSLAACTAELVQELWAPVYPSVSEAMASLRSGDRLTVALNRNLIVAGVGDDTKFGVYFRGERVGYITNQCDFWACGVPLDGVSISKIQKVLHQWK